MTSGRNLKRHLPNAKRLNADCYSGVSIWPWQEEWVGWSIIFGQSSQEEWTHRSRKHLLSRATASYLLGAPFTASLITDTRHNCTSASSAGTIMWRGNRALQSLHYSKNRNVLKQKIIKRYQIISFNNELKTKRDGRQKEQWSLRRLVSVGTMAVQLLVAHTVNVRFVHLSEQLEHTFTESDHIICKHSTI